MGLLGGSSKRSTTTTSTDIVTNANIGVQDSGAALTAAGNRSELLYTAPNSSAISHVSNSRITVTDYGALSGALALAQSTAEANRDNVAAVLGVADSAIDAGVGFGRAAFELASDLTGDYAGLTRNGLDFANDIFGQALDAAAADAERSGALIDKITGEARSALSYSLTQQAKTSDERLGEFAKVALFVVAAAIILPAMLKG